MSRRQKSSPLLAYRRRMQREIAKGNAIPKCPFVQNNSQSGGGSSSGGGGERPAQQLR